LTSRFGPPPTPRASWFGDDLVGSTMTAIRELQASFGDTTAQATLAYAQTMLDLRPELDGDVRVNDAVTAVTQFVRRLQG
jgi:hypothetical protein